MMKFVKVLAKLSETLSSIERLRGASPPHGGAEFQPTPYGSSPSQGQARSGGGAEFPAPAAPAVRRSSPPRAGDTGAQSSSEPLVRLYPLLLLPRLSPLLPGERWLCLHAGLSLFSLRGKLVS